MLSPMAGRLHTTLRCEQTCDTVHHVAGLVLGKEGDSHTTQLPAAKLCVDGVPSTVKAGRRLYKLNG